MSAVLPLSDHSPVSEEDVERFRRVVDIRDKEGFRELLNALVLSKSAEERKAAERQALIERMRASLPKPLDEPWRPSERDLQRGRVSALADFHLPSNLPLIEFAARIGMSRQHIYKLIKAGKLLALQVGKRGFRLPDWQLEAWPNKLTQEVMARSLGTDAWTLYEWLGTPHDRFGGRAPVDIVNARNLAQVADGVLDCLGIHP